MTDEFRHDPDLRHNHGFCFGRGYHAGRNPSTLPSDVSWPEAHDLERHVVAQRRRCSSSLPQG